jgi:hypothetical protein
MRSDFGCRDDQNEKGTKRKKRKGNEVVERKGVWLQAGLKKETADAQLEVLLNYSAPSSVGQLKWAWAKGGYLCQAEQM